MQFQFIDSILPEHTIQLEALAKDTNLYTSLLLQHKGTFQASERKFGNSDDCTEKFKRFLELAIDQNASLAITPEYSCPWSVINYILNTKEAWPSQKKLWILGCESITPDEIRALKKSFSQEDIHIHFDEEALKNGGGTLLDSACYIFQATDNKTGIRKLIVLVQFKTQHMGVWTDDIEQEKYIPGTEIYVLRNDVNSIYLFTIICSEVGNFKIDNNFRLQLDYRWDDNPYIVLNIQMNPKPSHRIFKEFRNAIMSFPHKDIISLNWARGSLFENGKPIITYSKSGFLLKSEQMNYDDEVRFTDNHNKGLYYTFKPHDLHAFYLNSYENVFLASHQKTSSGGANSAFFRRTGPEIRSNFEWSDSLQTFQLVSSITDDFISFLDRLNCTNSSLRDLQISVIDKERLINLTTGKVNVKPSAHRWYSIDNLQTFLLDDNEVVRRLTVLHDENGERDRIEYIEAIDLLNHTILPEPRYFPDVLSAFENNCTEVMFFKSDAYNYKYNLVTTDGKHKATIAYIGRNDEGTADRVLKTLQQLFEKDDQSRKLVVVWYKDGASSFVPKTEQSKPRATDDTKTETNSILKS